MVKATVLARFAWLVMPLSIPWLASAQQVQRPLPPPADQPHQHSTGAHVNLFPAREASGTSWLPDETPMYGVQRSWRGWNFMLHGSAFAQFIYEPGDIHRTGGFATRQLSSVNWGMVMARRPVGDGRVGFRLMSSLEPWTVTDCGF